MADAREPLDIAPGITVMDALKRVLRLPSICSKRFLTSKVDRTFTDLTGGACAIGEQPIKGLLDPKAMARLAVGEALTNLVWAKVTSLSDVKASGNWMYAAKLDGEGAAMYDAANALSDAMIKLGIAIDGGKDSLSMAAHAGGELGDDGVLLHIDLSAGKRRLGGSALAQVFDQIGNDCPDLEDVPYLKRVFEGVQGLLDDELISAGHDVSDGGLLVCALEMAFAGNCGINLDLTSHRKSLFQTLFSEELGLVIEVSKKNLDMVMGKLSSGGISAEIIGQVTATPSIELMVDGVTHLKESTSFVRDMWEETSFQLEKLQRLASCVDLEKEGLKDRHEPSWKLSFTPSFTDEKYMTTTSKPKVAVIREEGSNGDREMAAAFYAAGFEPWDITMSDLLNGAVSLHEFRGVVFVGGFSYADVLDSAKGPQVGGVLGGGGDPSQPRFIHNESGRFECRFTSVKIKDSPAIMLKGMEGSTLGVWAAHDIVMMMGLRRNFTLSNLNGSPLGVAAICSPDGRHLAMMPHPERCFLMWQFPWYPKQWDVEKKGPSPWLQMFQNAREWCSRNG
ncbi:hypothetical protein M0R45_024794 [Rubus argutus]|uniref:Phosphoribosylformylglycinamidine synthase n=1 Tax=Rubus argutus TaxID=59490 RepID=A0AAW1WTR7_RUBAR